MLYTGVTPPFEVIVLDPKPDSQGMILVRRICDRGVCWADPRYLEEVPIEASEPIAAAAACV